MGKDILGTRHPDYTKHVLDWQTIKDCLDGQTAIKSKTVTYLPFPVPLSDKIRNTKDFDAQYQIYLEGAVFVNHTSQAVEDLTAGIFKRDPMFEELPPELDGIDVESLSRDIAMKNVSFGRGFALVDYPTTDGKVTREQEKKKNIHAFVVTYEPHDILDWNEKRIGGKNVLQRVVLAERVVDESSGKEVSRYRELEIVDGVYTVTMYDEKGEQTGEPIQPRAMGKTLDHITGTFFGVSSNTPKVNKSPIIGIAQSNIKHYQTWAELKHVETYVGHPMLAITNAPNGFIKSANDNNVRIAIGASNALVIEGDKADAKIVEINGSNIIHFKSLEKLEQSMTDQGARLRSSNKNGVESGDALMIRNSGDNSVMASIATQTENTVETCVRFASEYMGAKGVDEWSVDLNKKFIDEKLDSSVVRELSALESAGQVPLRVLHEYLQRVGVLSVDEDLKKLADEIKDTNPTSEPFTNPTLDNNEGE